MNTLTQIPPSCLELRERAESGTGLRTSSVHQADAPFIGISGRPL